VSQRFNYEPPFPRIAGPAGPAGPAGAGPLSRITDGALVAGSVVKSVSAGHVDKASGGGGPTGPGEADGDGDCVIGVSAATWAPAATAQIYPTGQTAPIAGLPVGALYRSNTGTLINLDSVISGEWTQKIGVSDGAVFDVLIGEPFEKP
jgi:hypothetical protein